jgi:hypothetical protein
VSATSAMLRGRAAALALMVDTIVVTRLDPAGTTTNTETGVVTKAYTTIYSGIGKIQRQPRDILARIADVGQAELFTAHVEVHLPVTATGVASDDIATVTASPNDPDLVGKTFHIRELAAKTWQTARRFGAEQITG